MLCKLDQWLLFKVFNPILQQMGKRWGVTAGSAARGCLTAMCTFNVMHIAIRFTAHTNASIALLIGTLILSVVIYNAAKEADTWPNLNLYTLYLGRSVAVVLLSATIIVDALILVVALADLGWLAYTAGLYFASCPPPPPKEHKVEKLAIQTV